jgi:hypothetical protein
MTPLLDDDDEQDAVVIDDDEIGLGLESVDDSFLGDDDSADDDADEEP